MEEFNADSKAEYSA